jgi:hypothetical protein
MEPRTLNNSSNIGSDFSKRSGELRKSMLFIVDLDASEKFLHKLIHPSLLSSFCSGSDLKSRSCLMSIEEFHRFLFFELIP